jgi:phosphotriesterase-related protein
MDRRKFLRDSTLAAGSLLLTSQHVFSQTANPEFMGVLGPIKEKDLGITLIHEHVMADFIGAAQTGPHRYKIEEVVARALPFLADAKKAGCKTFVDCTGAYLGRDARVLKQSAIESGLNILAATGNYGAVDEKFLPPFAYSDTAEQLAARWIGEWKNGIDNTGIRPGLIKTSVDNGPLKPIHTKLITAAAITHLQTGLSISVHTGDGSAAMEEIEILQKAGVHLSAYRWVHAQNEKDKALHLRAAKAGAWIEFDGINPTIDGNIEEHVAFVKNMKDNGFLKQTLISQDAGWYNVGEPNGGNFRGFTGIFEKFIPALKAAGLTNAEVDELLVNNPKESLRIKVRKA